MTSFPRRRESRYNKNVASETKTCQNCHDPFTIEPDDFAFYEKIDVPPPTFCPECRLQRQTAFRNVRSLYHRACEAPGHSENLISMFAPDADIVVYDQKYWWSDAWNPLDYGKSYDFSQNFFIQFKELMSKVPWPNVVSTNSTNSDYCNSILNHKNCYLVFSGIDNENCGYAEQVDLNKDSYDLKKAFRNELCYELVNCNECYATSFSAFSTACVNSAFLYDCRGCTNCFGCVGLRNKSYYIFNRQYAKEEYLKKIGEYGLGSYQALSATKAKFDEMRLAYPYRHARIFYSSRSTGDVLTHAKNCHSCFDSLGEAVEDSRYIYHPYGKPVRDCQSVFTLSGGERCYEVISCRMCSDIICAKKIWTGHRVKYSYNCHNCNNIFGCVGLRDKSYCIFNRQYTKEEYESMEPKIIVHMNAMPYTDAIGRVYRYGEFFPVELSQFSYNETVAQEYMPLIKDEAEKLGFTWRDPDTKNYRVTKNAEGLPDHIRDVTDSILEETIGCAHEGNCNDNCTTAFKLIPPELQFYRKMNLALPRLCPNCRHFERLRKRNPAKLWHRSCHCAGEKSENGVYTNTGTHPSHAKGEPCPNEFETSYAPDRPEIVYCESCYNAEIA